MGFYILKRVGSVIPILLLAVVGCGIWAAVAGKNDA